jgi:hypothetical protein
MSGSEPMHLQQEASRDIELCVCVCVGRYMHQLPSWIHMGMLFFVLTIEVGLVFMIFGPRLFRRTACVYMCLLHVFYILIGNQGTFHWNQLVLCLVLLDDALFPSLVALLKRIHRHGVYAQQQQQLAASTTNKTFRAKADSQTTPTAARKVQGRRMASANNNNNTAASGNTNNATLNAQNDPSGAVIWHSRLTILVAVLVVVLTTVPLSVMTSKAVMAPAPVLDLYRFLYPFKIVNFYGPFYLVRRERMDIVIQGSIDAQNWYDYDNLYKPDGHLARPPPFASPHISRVCSEFDNSTLTHTPCMIVVVVVKMINTFELLLVVQLEYRLWQAAYSDYQQEIWISRALHRILESSEPVERLFKRAPIDEMDGEPEYIRAVRYTYRFTSWNATQGEYWSREFSDIYTPSFSQTITQMNDKRKSLRKRVAHQVGNS